MSHVLFVNIPALSHLYPTLPVVTELIRRGHRVSYAAAQERSDLLASIGARVLPYESSRPNDSDPAYRIYPPGEHMARGLHDFLTEAELTLPQLEQAILHDPPDLVLFDRLAFQGSILARKLGIPAVQMWPMMVAGPLWSWVNQQDLEHPLFLSYTIRLEKFLANQGLPITPEEFLTPPVRRHLVFVPRAFQINGDLFDESYSFVGPCLGDRPMQTVWEPRPGKDVLLITLGSLDNCHPDFYRGCFDAFAGTAWHVVMPIGSRFDPRLLGRVPANFEIAPTFPQLEVLRDAKVFVSHAGLGGVLEALHAGVPQVALPRTREQQANARRLAELGIGLHPAGLDGLREAVAQAAADALMAHRISALRDEVARTGGAARAADVIEDCLLLEGLPR
jgi:MGT family glycosyltransferase